MSKKPYIVRGGKLYVQITRDGQRVRFSTGLKDSLPNRKFVESNLDSILANRARASVKSKNSLAHFLDRFLDEAKTLKKSSQISYKSSVKKLNALMATNKDIASFTRADIEELYAKLNARAVSVSVASRLKMVLTPIILLGIFAGLAKFFARDDDPESEASWRDFFYHAISSMVVCVIIYALLDSTNLSYMSRFAVAGLVSFFGVDKALEYAQKILALRGGGGNSHEVHKRDSTPTPQNPKREETYD